MENPQSKSGVGGVIMIIFIVIAIGAGVYFGFFSKKSAPANHPAVNQPVNGGTAEDNFEKTGNLIKNNPGLKSDVWYLTYEEPGKPAFNTELVIDAQSSCLYGMDRELPCESLEFDQGERVKITGTEKDGTVTVKTLMPFLVKGAPWEDVASFIGNCDVTRASQNKDLQVKVWLKNDMEIWTDEPAFDDILTETDAAKETCGDIPLSTE